MSAAPTPQKEAEALIADIEAMNEGTLNKNSYIWPSIDYDHVSTKTCEEITTLINQKTRARGYLPVTPETPRPVRIAREINCIVTQRHYLMSRRVLDAQNLDEHITKNLTPIFEFLRAARRDTKGEQFTFPEPPQRLLHSLSVVRDAINAVEDMVRGNEDLEETEDDSDREDPDKTKVEDVW